MGCRKASLQPGAGIENTFALSFYIGAETKVRQVIASHFDILTTKDTCQGMTFHPTLLLESFH